MDELIRSFFFFYKNCTYISGTGKYRYPLVVRNGLFLRHTVRDYAVGVQTNTKTIIEKTNKYTFDGTRIGYQ